jgi:predicted RND superfamily exporter protein
MLALGCAYSMHLIAAARGAQSAAALESQLAAAFEPTAFSGLTTAIGFLAVGTVRIAAIEQLGGYGALGVLFVGAPAWRSHDRALVIDGGALRVRVHPR